MKMKRVVLVVLDSVGIGAAKDAAKYGDGGSDTLGHVTDLMRPDLPNLTELGLYNAANRPEAIEDPLACFGRMQPASAGKDTTTGHWELAGLTLKTPFPTYPNGFPRELIEQFERETGMEVIGNKPASGTAIIEELGNEHLLTGKLIVYTSADSVFQIAAHENIVPPMELWHICRIARRMLTGEHGVGRVIARPFTGDPGAFTRTENRRDFSIDPIGETMLDVVRESGMDVLGVGKIEDIFNHRGLTQSVHPSGNDACVDAMLDFIKEPKWQGLLFANLVDFDMLYGHRNDPEGYAKSLEAFDKRLPEIMRAIGEDTLLLITADHGCDPTTPSTDHSREDVPILAWSLGINEGIDLGTRTSFADVAATTLEALGLSKKLDGTSFWKEIC